MREKVEYNQKDLDRPMNYMVVMCHKNVDTHLIDLDEAANYSRVHKRRAIILSDREVFNERKIPKTNYFHIPTATTPGVKLIDNDRKPYREVYKYVLDKFKNGLIIAYPETITNDIADEFARSTGKGQDFIAYRNDLLELTGQERTKLTYMRIHANPEFDTSQGFFENVKEKFNERNTIGIFLCQYIANYQYNECNKYFNELSEKYEKMGMTDYINYRELNSQMAYFVYFDTIRSKVLNIPREKLLSYLQMMLKAMGVKMNNQLIEQTATILCDE